ncbi:uncharacterized protein [Heliangelus exortis]|uniref:uncharacterized protein n=1 Tax=Heliangelus exortis TaxID=472823 RepID=UPI003A907BC0
MFFPMLQMEYTKNRSDMKRQLQYIQLERDKVSTRWWHYGEAARGFPRAGQRQRCPACGQVVNCSIASRENAEAEGSARLGSGVLCRPEPAAATAPGSVAATALPGATRDQRLAGTAPERGSHPRQNMSCVPPTRGCALRTSRTAARKGSAIAGPTQLSGHVYSNKESAAPCPPPRCARAGSGSGRPFRRSGEGARVRSGRAWLYSVPRGASARGKWRRHEDLPLRAASLLEIRGASASPRPQAWGSLCSQLQD